MTEPRTAAGRALIEATARWANARTRAVYPEGDAPLAVPHWSDVDAFGREVLEPAILAIEAEARAEPAAPDQTWLRVRHTGPSIYEHDETGPYVLHWSPLTAPGPCDAPVHAEPAAPDTRALTKDMLVEACSHPNLPGGGSGRFMAEYVWSYLTTGRPATLDEARAALTVATTPDQEAVS